MDTNHDLMVIPTVSEAHPETLDFLSRSWCNFAVQALQPELHDPSSVLVQSTSTKMFEGDALKMERSISTGEPDYMKSTPSWRSNDLKSWIWMQQAMHPELNYSTGFQNKLFQWKKPFGNMSIKKWFKNMKEKRKEEKRLQKAEVHAAVSIAGLAAALAAIAEENSKGKLQLEQSGDNPAARNAALASATAIVASQCALVAQSMGAGRSQLSNVISSALSGTSTSDILTLTAAASTSLRGAATLKARAGCKSRALSGAPVMPIEMDPTKIDDDLDFERCTSVLAKGAKLTIFTPDGKSMVRLVCIHLNNEAKVILKIMKVSLLNVITSKKECVVLDLHAELYQESGGDEYDTCYQIVLTTTRGSIKLDMAADYQRYKMWATTIQQMLKLAQSPTNYHFQFCRSY